MQTVKLSTGFMEYFSVVLANTDELRKEVYKIRYNVYCDELGFEDKEAFPEGLEQDDFDDFSTHLLLFHKATGAYAGTVRLVQPAAGSNEQILPMEKFCSHALDQEIVELLNQKPGTITEASRLAVPAIFRRRKGEDNKPFVYHGERADMASQNPAYFPYISVGLYLAAATILVKDLDYIMVMMEPRLARHLARVGIHFESAGQLIDYHGERAPYYISPKIFLDHVKPHIRELFDAIQEELLPQLDRV